MDIPIEKQLIESCIIALSKREVVLPRNEAEYIGGLIDRLKESIYSFEAKQLIAEENYRNCTGGKE